VRADLKYTEHHEWVASTDDESVFTVGITDFAQDALGDVAYCELPEINAEVTSGEQCGSIESVKAVSDLFSPLSGEVVEVNQEIVDTPGTVNKSPYDEGWLFKVKCSDDSQIDELMDNKAYKEFLKEQS